ncbi:1,2-phenylacetyl-CoA epoxidase subunit PaaC [Sphingomonas japonica]|uniref:Ring-1,2-phenylacetyl-CoA epoxidase subunit PaaC n=1 Tax=Sphingomonas japonica TaxID=511662 RepID=A0ABX0U1M9_9SPHN|nr:1,2-phenylacetyl-CoA epoxidase subunit PaaC [Sphingomonas japonica]NIJ22697.1 ring-1,2-phenylacetyl-CoA epoxidase subunit PaaC [Sphingomonas japonica]
MPSLPTIQPQDEARADRASHAGTFDAPVADDHRDAHFDYLLRLGDDALILGQRLSEWCGHAPALEVDLSLANIGLDLIGQATLFLDHAASVEGAGRDADALAFRRDVLQFRNCVMVEQPNGDFARTMARQFLFSTAHVLLLDALTASADPQIAAIAAKGVKEVRYHADLSADWVIRLGDGTDESRARMIDGFDWHWRFVDELFAMDAIEERMVAAGIAADRAALRPAFDARLQAVLDEATIPVPELPRAVVGGRKGHHSEHLGHLLAVMQHLPRSYPDATW